MTVFIIIGGLFLALIVIVPLLERAKIRISDEDAGTMSRWILPLVLVIAIANLIMLMMRQ